MSDRYPLLSLLVAVWFFQSAGVAAELLNVDYEDGRISSPEIGVSAVLPNATDAIISTKEFSRSGAYSVRTKVDHTDQYISAGKHRAESDAMKSRSARYNSGDKRRYQFSVMLDRDWQVSETTAVDIIWQFKRTAGGPDMFVGVKRGSIVLRHMKDQDILVKSYKPGEWMDFRFDISWSAGADGLVECWVRTEKDTRASKVLTYSGPNIDGTRAKEFGYVKWGLYRPDADEAVDVTKARIVYHDDIVIADLP
ncbi:MAG: heparin lyase I family protein [Planctomycetota bacterium]|nr:heparin lyase I family protein [Planctomycetota bacterium]